MSDLATPPQPGATYKFTVRTADEAVQTIRDRLGENARVLSVRQVGGQGLGGLFGKPKLEVIAQVGESEPGRSKTLGTSAEAAVPANFAGSGVGLPERSPLVEPLFPPLPSSPPSAVGRTHRDALPRLPDLLRRSGFSETLLSRLETAALFSPDEQRPLHRALAEVGQQLRRQASQRRIRPLPARSAFLGTAGVGRTTALCKWLAKEIFGRQKKGRVIKAEFDRPNPAEGLAVFCEVLGLSLEYYSSDPEDALSTAEDAAQDFLYADLPGISLKSPSENGELSKFLEREKFTGRVLVLNALYDSSTLRRIYAAGADLGATHVVFTHLDELEHWGRLWDFLLEGELTPLFLATGPSLTGDCEEDAVDAVLRKTLPGA